MLVGHVCTFINKRYPNLTLLSSALCVRASAVSGKALDELLVWWSVYVRSQVWHQDSGSWVRQCETRTFDKCRSNAALTGANPSQNNSARVGGQFAWRVLVQESSSSCANFRSQKIQLFVTTFQIG